MTGVFSPDIKFETDFTEVWHLQSSTDHKIILFKLFHSTF